jgi:hypothetical protein
VASLTLESDERWTESGRTAAEIDEAMEVADACFDVCVEILAVDVHVYPRRRHFLG